jgi:energy-coupling factor transporter ATP-binding protein EcfA2
LEFHPNFNVIIGGRGSGKSTIVAALRSLYGTGENLPSRLQAEVGDFVDNVFLTAELKSSHYIQESQEIRQCQWTHSGGSETVMNGNAVLTNFPVTVISQKELFERAAGDKNDPFLASHSLLALLDEGIGYGYSDAKSVGAWQRRVDDARNDWSNAVRTWIELTTDLNQLPAIKQQMATLQTQVDAFAAPEVTARVQRINARATERQFLKNEEELVRNLIRNATNTLSEAIAETPVPETLEGYADEFLKRVAEYRLIRSNLLTEGMDAIRRAEAKLESSKTNVEQTEWFKACEAASADHERYRQELEAKGLSSSEFSRLEGQLAQARENVKQLESKMGDLAGVQEQVADAWTALIRLYVERRNSRGAVLEAIRDRSGSLRFNLDVHADTTRWCERVREIAGLRSDAFLTEVPELAQWIWVREPDELERRWGIWRLAIATGDFEAIQTETRLRSSFFQRLAGLDMVIRLQLASELADDAVSMLFLKEGGRPETDGDWQSVTQGSPGQRTAAMLAFVLHHGREPLVLDQPEDDLDSEWISRLVVKELRQSRWSRQLIVVSHNANVPVLGDAEQITAMENRNGSIRIRSSTGVGVGGVSQEIPHVGPVEYAHVRQDIQLIMEGGVQAFVRRERRYHNETRLARAVE